MVPLNGPWLFLIVTRNNTFGPGMYNVQCTFAFDPNTRFWETSIGDNTTQNSQKLHSLDCHATLQYPLGHHCGLIIRKCIAICNAPIFSRIAPRCSRLRNSSFTTSSAKGGIQITLFSSALIATTFHLIQVYNNLGKRQIFQ